MKDKSSVHFIFYIVESSHAHQHCLHAWPTLIHGNSGHVAVRAGAREWCLMNRSLDARSWSACSWLLYCSMQRVMFRPCTHLSDHDTWSNQKVTWSNTCPSRDWPYVMSRQNNQTERDQLMVNSLLYKWCTFPWLYKQYSECTNKLCHKWMWAQQAWIWYTKAAPKQHLLNTPTISHWIWPNKQYV